jgi:hypothetical protein
MYNYMHSPCITPAMFIVISDANSRREYFFFFDTSRQNPIILVRAAQTGVFDLDIRISNRPFIDVCKSFAAETGLKSRNVEKRINAV